VAILKVHFKEISLTTSKQLDLVDITKDVLSFVTECTIESGICLVNSPHSTTAIFVNEHESGLKEDILRKVREEFPGEQGSSITGLTITLRHTWPQFS
jgi:secondary thiamine-phosphate synthase enzyme